MQSVRRPILESLNPEWWLYTIEVDWRGQYNRSNMLCLGVDVSFVSSSREIYLAYDVVSGSMPTRVRDRALCWIHSTEECFAAAE
jgi:hypothetical protein